jgi:hypothetical protein
MPDKDYYIDEEGNVRVNYEKSSFEPIPAGEYDLIIQNIEIREGQTSGKPYFNIELRVSDPDDSLDNKPVWENISPSVNWRVSQLLEAVYGPQDVEEGEELEFNIFDLYGARVRARVGLEERQDGAGMTNTILRFLPSVDGEAALTPVQPPKKAKPKAKAKAKGKRTSKK